MTNENQIVIQETKVGVINITSGDTPSSKIVLSDNEIKVIALAKQGPEGAMGADGAQGVDGAPGLGALTWNYIAGTTSPVLANNGYHVDNPAMCTLTLPATFAYGAAFSVFDINGGTFRISQNSGQVIYFGETMTTVGSSGYILSEKKGDTITVQCAVANNVFVVWNAVGNFKFY